MKVIGLTGGSGSGKGFVSSILVSRGIIAIDTDALYKDMTFGPSECMSELALEFGDGIVTPDGALDRAAMRSLVFSGEGADNNRRRLNEITHKHVLREVRRIISVSEATGAPAVLVDAPLLFESGFDRECDAVVAVIAPLDVRISRIIARDGISRDAALLRIATQMPDDTLISRSDLVIRNGGDEGELTADINAVLELIFDK